MCMQIPKNIDSKNIFVLIQELLSKQKGNNKKHGKMLVLSIVERQNMQYQKHLDAWAQKSEEIKEAKAVEFEKLKESLNSKGGWFIGGMILGGAVLGFLVGGPAGAVIGAMAAGALVGGGILGDYVGSGDKIFFDDNKEIDVIKLKKRDDEIEKIARESKHIQDKANVAQSEISRTMQIEMETIQQLETAASNMIVRLAELQGRTANMMR